MTVIQLFVVELDQGSHHHDKEGLLHDDDPGVEKDSLCQSVLPFASFFDAQAKDCQDCPESDEHELSGDHKGERAKVIVEVDRLHPHGFEFGARCLDQIQLKVLVEEVSEVVDVEGCDRCQFPEEAARVCRDLGLQHRQQDDYLEGIDHSKKLLQTHSQKAVGDKDQDRCELSTLTGTFKFLLKSLRTDRDLFYHHSSESLVLWQNLDPALCDEQVRVVEADLEVVRRRLERDEERILEEHLDVHFVWFEVDHLPRGNLDFVFLLVD